MAKSMCMLSQSLQQPQQQDENNEDQREIYKFTLIVIIEEGHCFYECRSWNWNALPVDVF